MTRHTPGPWRVAVDEPYDAQRPTHFLEDQIGHQLMLLARLPEVGSEQHVSNLHLIAASPELLEHLSDLLAAVRTATLEDPTHYVVANAVGLAALRAQQVVDRLGSMP